MKLAQTIMENEKANRQQQSREILRIRLRELVFSYPKEVTEVLHKTGVPVSSVLSSPVLLAVVVKHLPKNPQLREAIAQMILEMDGYASADGSKWTVIGGAVSAVGSVLSGLGRSQSQKNESESTAAQLEAEHQKELEAQKARNKRNTIIIISIALIVIIGIVVAMRTATPAKKAITQSTVK